MTALRHKSLRDRPPEARVAAATTITRPAQPCCP
jgi:hypothetical protein